MRLDWIFLARYAEVPDDGTLNALGAGLDSLMVEEGSLPVRGGIYLATRVVAPMLEWRKKGHELTTSIVKPDGKIVKAQRVNLKAMQTPSRLSPDAEPGLLLALPHILTITAFGSYAIEAVLDNSEPYRLIFTVRRANLVP